MMKRNANSYTSGTSALVMPRWVQQPDEAAIIMFPGTVKAMKAAKHDSDKQAVQQECKKPLARRLADSSEMLCSLKYESMLGCPYHLFTRQGIAALSTGAALIGIVSLILGS